MGERIFKRFAASFLALILAFLCGCFPSAFASESGGSAMPSDERAVAIGDALAEMGGLDGGWALTLMTYLSANGISLESYGNDGEDLTNVLMKYYREYYSTSPAGIAGIAVGDFIADAISGTALGISRIVGAVNGAFNLLIRAPLAAELHDFLDWWNEKFNPSGSVETAETVEISRNTLISGVTVPLVDGSSFALATLPDGGLIRFFSGYFINSNIISGSVLFSNLSTSSSVQFAGGSFRIAVVNGKFHLQFSTDGFSTINFYVDLGTTGTSNRTVGLDATETGVKVSVGDVGSSMPPSGYTSVFSFLDLSGNYVAIPYSYFYSGSGQFSSSGLSAVTMKQSSDGQLSYGPSGSSAGTIIQSGETISIPVVAPSIEGNAVSFSAVDTVADLLAKALTIVEDSVADAADTALELPSTVGELIPDIELFDDLEINWADDTPVTLTPSPSPLPVPDLPVTVIPTSLPSPWPVSPDQFAVVTSDGRTALIDITDTIKGWTESLTGIYQSYVDLLGSVFGFLPEEIQVLFKWSLAALVFTGVFKRFWWDHH